MFHVPDDVLLVRELFQDLAAVHETAARGEAEPQLAFQFTQGIRLATSVRHQPDLGHAAAVQQFFKIKPVKFLWICHYVRHPVKNLAQPPKGANKISDPICNFEGDKTRSLK